MQVCSSVNLFFINMYKYVKQINNLLFQHTQYLLSYLLKYAFM